VSWTRIYLIGRVEVQQREGARPSNLYYMRGSKAPRPKKLRENCITSGSPLCNGLTRATYIFCVEHRETDTDRVSVGNQTRDLLHGRRTLHAKSHLKGVTNYYSEPQLVLLQSCLFVTGSSPYADPYVQNSPTFYYFLIFFASSYSI
jgi:hypothetical protein